MRSVGIVCSYPDRVPSYSAGVADDGLRVGAKNEGVRRSKRQILALRCGLIDIVSELESVQVGMADARVTDTRPLVGSGIASKLNEL